MQLLTAFLDMTKMLIFDVSKSQWVCHVIYTFFDSCFGKL